MKKRIVEISLPGTGFHACVVGVSHLVIDIQDLQQKLLSFIVESLNAGIRSGSIKALEVLEYRRKWGNPEDDPVGSWGFEWVGITVGITWFAYVPWWKCDCLTWWKTPLCRQFEPSPVSDEEWDLWTQWQNGGLFWDAGLRREFQLSFVFLPR